MAAPIKHLKRPYHVVHVIGALQTGGAEKMVVNFLQAVDREDFRHTVICLNHEGELAPLVRAAGIDVKVHRVRFRSCLRDLRSLAAWLRDEQVAVIHSHMYYATVWSHLAGLWAGVPVRMTTEHGKELWKKPHHVALGRWLSDRSCGHIAVSQDVRDVRVARHRIPRERLTVVPNGVPIPPPGERAGVRAAVRAEFGLQAGRPVLGSVGRVVPAKDYPTLLEALGRARRTVPDLHWLQIGDGPDLPALIARAAALGLTGAVTFAGRRDDVGDLLAALDLWVMSSVREGLPVSLLEAMAAGRPVVATDVGGIPDAVTHGESAWLVPAGDPEALAAGILRLLGDPGLAGSLAAAARERVAGHYGIEAVGRTITDLYRAGLRSRGLPI